MDLACFSFVFVSRNLRKTESRKNKLEELLNSVGARVNELKEKYVLVSLLRALHAACSAASLVLWSRPGFVIPLVLVLRVWCTDCCS